MCKSSSSVSSFPVCNPKISFISSSFCHFPSRLALFPLVCSQNLRGSPMYVKGIHAFKQGLSIDLSRINFILFMASDEMLIFFYKGSFPVSHILNLFSENFFNHNIVGFPNIDFPNFTIICNLPRMRSSHIISASSFCYSSFLSVSLPCCILV